MNWEQFYHQPLTLQSYLYNLSRHRELLAEVMSIEPRRVLEIGAGSGAMSIFLSTLGIEVTSIDNNPKVLAMAQENSKLLRGNVAFGHRDAFNINLSSHFDLAFSQGFLEHFDDDDVLRLLDEQLGVARKVVFDVPSNYYFCHGDEKLRSLKQWRKLLRKYNLVKTQPYGVELFKWLVLQKLKHHKHPFYLLKPNQVLIHLEPPSNQ